jgi:hypothetical protein
MIFNKSSTWLGQKQNVFGQLEWVIPLQIPTINHLGIGMQFCPSCLSEDITPYFRRFWRVAFATYCPKHMISLIDLCPSCSNPILLISQNAKILGEEINPLISCQNCKYDLRLANSKKIVNTSLISMYDRFLDFYFQSIIKYPDFTKEIFNLLHLFIKIIIESNKTILKNTIFTENGVFCHCNSKNKLPYEQMDNSERHFILLLCLELIEDIFHSKNSNETIQLLYRVIRNDRKNNY